MRTLHTAVGNENLLGLHGYPAWKIRRECGPCQSEIRQTVTKHAVLPGDAAEGVFLAALAFSFRSAQGMVAADYLI
jgi:hypothetical protein